MNIKIKFFKHSFSFSLGPEILISILYVFIPIISLGQDTLIMNSGEIKVVMVKRVGVDKVEFIRFDNQTGPTYEEAKSKIKKIVYQNGTFDHFENVTLASDEDNTGENIFIDVRDSITYTVVVIGNQTWMHENLKYRVGQSVCHQDSIRVTCDECGRYYDHKEALRACPPGWHLPSDKEWMALEINAGMLKSEAEKNGWRGTYPGQAPKLLKEGETGLNLLFCGWIVPSGYPNKEAELERYNHNEFGYYWTSTEHDKNRSYVRHFAERKSIKRFATNNQYRFPVRCVKDEAEDNAVKK